MRRFWIARGIKWVLIAAVAVLAFGFVVMSLWNWLLPPIAGWHTISLVQAIGLLVLARILFGGVHGRGGHYWRHRMHERWAQMTPEERERFRSNLHGRCGHSHGPTPPAAQA